MIAVLVAGGTASGADPSNPCLDPSWLDVNSVLSCQASTLDFAEPPVLRSKDGELHVSLRAEVKQNAFRHAFGEIKLETATYDGRLVGPTICVRRGDRLTITVHNRLRASWCRIPLPKIDENFPHEFCVTNLHTHGLHISPEGNADNVYVSIYPNRSHRYEYDMPEGHPSGTFWYHPHRHGSVAMQLTGGMAGALIVEGDLDDLPSLAKVRQRVLVLQQIHVSPSTDGSDIQRPSPSDIYDKWQEANGQRPATSRAQAAADQPPPISPYSMINGQYAPKITMASGAIERWRFIHAGNDEGFNLAVVKDPCDPSAAKYPLYEIAIDGIARGKLVKRQSNVVYPAYRWDVLFQAPSPGEYYLINERMQPL